MQSNGNKIMINLVIYVFVFTLIVCIVSGLMSYFYGNIQKINKETKANSDFSNLNLYFLKTVQTSNLSIKNYGLVDYDDTSSYYITFQRDDGGTTTFIKLGNNIYCNKIKLCEDAGSFKIIVDKSERQSVYIEVKILDKVYNSQYALNY